MSTKKETIGAQIVLDGEREFKQALSNINAGLRVNASEMKLLTAQYAQNGESEDALAKKSDILQRQLLSQVDKVNTLSAALEASAQKYGESDAKTMKWQETLNKSKAELIAMRDAYNANTEQLQRITAKTEKYGDASATAGKETAEAGKKSSSAFSGMLSKIDDLSGGAISAFRGIIEQVQETGSVTDASSEIMSTALKGAPVAAAGTVVAAIIKIGKEAHEASLEVKTSAARMEAALGLTRDAANEAAQSVKDIYKNGLADSKEDAQEALTNVMRLMNLQGESAEDAAKKIIAMGVDSREAARTAGTMMNQFGISAEQALDVMAKGLTTSANKNDDLLDVLNEYSPSFQRMGYTADEFLTKLVAATDAGAYSADKAADVMKEFYNKAASGDQAFAEALQKLGINADSTINSLTAGGDRAKAAFERVAEKLSNVSNGTKQAQIASELFGSQWEDVGTKATLALSKTSTEVINTAGEAQRWLDVLSKDAATVETSIDRTFEDVGNIIKESVSSAATPFGMFEGIKKGAIGVYEGIQALSETDGKESGKAMVNGVVEGWEGQQEELYRTVEKTAKESNRRFNAAAEINSPSKLFERESGVNMAKGVGVGWDKEMERVQRDMQNSVKRAAPVIAATPSFFAPPAAYREASSYASPAKTPAASTTTYNITIDAKNVKEFNDVVWLAETARQQRRAK